jgi:uncharacterized lipoprotein YehR (DUF1307 family)
MKNLFSGKALFATVLIFALFIVLTGFSQNKSGESQQGDAIKLAYSYLPDKAIKYQNVSKIIQDMDINGQSMLVNVDSYFSVFVRLEGKLGENLNLEIKIDSMAQNIESPQGYAGGSVNDVKGKVFNMVITPAGKTLDLTEASKIVFNIEGSGERTLEQSFLNYFPALPEGPVKVGDTWISHDTIDSKTQTMSMWMPVESTYKFEGIETIDGIDCAKLSATLTGSQKMTTQSQGMEINIAGTFTGTQILLFAVKDGYFIKETVTSKMTGNIDIPDQGMTFPLVMDTNSTNEIVK